MLSSKNAKSILLILAAVEMLSVTYMLMLPALAWLASVLNLLAGVGISILLLRAPGKDSQRQIQYPLRSSFNSYMILISAAFIFFIGKNILSNIPMNYKVADMLPIIKVMNRRFLDGQWDQVYNPIPEIWNGIKPIYLPAMWVPFSAAVMLNIDLRWITMISLWLSWIACISWLRPKKKDGNDLFYLSILFLFLGWLLLGDERHGYISFSEEPLVAFYYILLVYALINEQYWLIGIGTFLCFFSRYALIGWVPAFMIYLIQCGKMKQLVIFMSSGLICLLLLVILPFGWNAFEQFFHLPAEYIKFAGNIWKDYPEVYTDGPGLAKFFGPGRMGQLHLTLIILTIMIPCLLALYSYYRKKNQDNSNIPLATLKLTVVIFYNFIDVPFLYLFYTSCFISLFTAGYFLRAEEYRPVSAQA